MAAALILTELCHTELILRSPNYPEQPMPLINDEKHFALKVSRGQ